MKHIEHNLNAIKRRIMVRVWYSYALSLMERSTFMHGFVLGGLVAVFGRLTHVAALTGNLSHVPASSLPSYVWDTIVAALTGGEVVTVLVTLCLVLLSITALMRLAAVVTHLHRSHKEVTA